ncbi:MAG: helix-turn-helix domain-containing protein, partial [Anaerolineaceae bacterium]|nr:helix-turn-helix domain-containing protein [Anaerolineaceae bacterium]
MARGLEVLELLSNSEQPLGVTQIAAVVNYDKSTVYRLLSTLMARGYVVQDPDTRRYMPGLQILSLSR